MSIQASTLNTKIEFDIPGTSIDTPPDTEPVEQCPDEPMDSGTLRITDSEF